MADIRGELVRPIIQPILRCMDEPYVDMNAATVVAYATIDNEAPDSDVVLTTEYSGAKLSIFRYRKGTDAGFAVIVNAQNMTEVNGYATYAYTFPNASWQNGDKILYMLSGLVVLINGMTYTVPNVYSYGTMVAAPTGTSLEVEQSESGVCNINEYQMFQISLTDVASGAIPSANIDITGISVAMAISVGGADFTVVGITQPVFAKDDGRVYCSYIFDPLEWTSGDMYRLVVTGIKATIGGTVLFVPAMVWSNVVSGTSSSTGIFYEQADVPVNVTAIVAGVNILDLSVANTRYIVRDLIIKCADPGVDTVTIKLYRLINDFQILVASHDINHVNYGMYFTLMDMFSLPYIAGDDLLITAVASANSYLVTGQYSYAKTNV